MSDPETPTPEAPLPPTRSPRVVGAPVVFFFLFTVVCIGSAVWVVLNADQLGLRRGAAVPVTQVAAEASAETQFLRRRVVELEAELAAARGGERGAAQTGLDAGAASLLAARIERLEAAQARSAGAASSALAAATLADAAQTSRPFTGELAALERLGVSGDAVRSLRPLAETGAPTRAALAAEFPDVAARAARAARASDGDESLLGRALGALGSLVTVRRVDDLTGAGPDAVLARAERRVGEGDLEGALEQLRALPPPALEATAGWRERARRRLEIERGIAALRTSALGDLALAAEERRS